MSFEADKARLIQELVDARAQLRADYKMAPRKDSLTDTTSAAAKQDTKSKLPDAPAKPA